ncbi:MAG: hypothetical protein HRU05_20205 [Oceanospirillaceae bacterium]|nr:hypothetical protein [Oceanospirillaceae bacterium]
MSAIQALLASIVGHLNSAESWLLNAELQPENWQQHYVTNAQGTVLVQFGGDQFTADDSSACVYERRITLGFTLMVRNLNDRGGCYDNLDLLRQLLTGFKPENCRKLQPKSSRFIARTKDVWVYLMEFTTSTLAVTAPPEMGPLMIKKVILEASQKPAKNSQEGNKDEQQQ